MFPEKVYKSIFQNPSPGRCSLVANLAGTYFFNKAAEKSLQDSYCNTGQFHMHFNGTNSFQYFSRTLSSSIALQKGRFTFFW